MLYRKIEKDIFEAVSSVEEFHLRVSSIAGDRLGAKEETLIFLDEIQQYPRLLTLLKFLRQEGIYLKYYVMFLDGHGSNESEILL